MAKHELDYYSKVPDEYVERYRLDQSKEVRTEFIVGEDGNTSLIEFVDGTVLHISYDYEYLHFHSNKPFSMTKNVDKDFLMISFE